MATRMQQRRGTAAQWAAANPVLADGEVGFEKDTGIVKIGNGSTVWNQLPVILTGTFLSVSGKAFDADRLDGLDGTAYALKTYVDTALADLAVTTRQSLVSRAVTAAATLAATDAGKIVQVNAATNVNITIPVNALVAFPIGSRVGIQNINGTGVPSVVTAGATLDMGVYPTYCLPQKNDTLWLLKTGTDSWIVDSGVKDSGRIIATMSTGFDTSTFVTLEQTSYRLRNGIVYIGFAVVRDTTSRVGTMFQVPAGWEPGRTMWTQGFAGPSVAGEVRIQGNSRNVEFPSAGNPLGLFVGAIPAYPIRNS